jgi:hypothetical protein
MIRPTVQKFCLKYFVIIEEWPAEVLQFGSPLVKGSAAL